MCCANKDNKYKVAVFISLFSACYKRVPQRIHLIRTFESEHNVRCCFAAALCRCPFDYWFMHPVQRPPKICSKWIYFFLLLFWLLIELRRLNWVWHVSNLFFCVLFHCIQSISIALVRIKKYLIESPFG